MGYYDTIKHYRGELKRCINNNDVYGTKLNCKAYIKILDILSRNIDSFNKKLYIASLKKDFEIFLEIIEQEGISERVQKVDVDGERLVIPPPAKTAPSVSVPINRISVQTPQTPPASQTGNGGTLKKSADNPLMANISGCSDREVPVSRVIGQLPPKNPNSPSTSNAGVNEVPKQLPTEEPAKQLPVNPPKASPSEFEDGEWSADIFEKYLPCTAVISNSFGQGTGFFISKNGYLLTNHHVVFYKNTRDSSLCINTGDNKMYSNVEFVDADKKLDIALLKVNVANVPYIPIIENYNDVRVGSNMMLIGNGLGYGLAPITGTVKFTKHSTENNLVYTAPSNSGDSGSPVLNRHGMCIGIHKSRAAAPQSRGIAFATPSSSIRAKLDEWKKKYNITFQY